MGGFFRGILSLIILVLVGQRSLSAPSCGEVFQSSASLRLEQATMGNELEWRKPSQLMSIPFAFSKSNVNVNVKALNDFKEAIAKKCHDCEINPILDNAGTVISYKVKYKDGTPGYEITLDPGVIEVKMQPSTSPSWVNASGKIKEELYQAAEEAGFSKPSIGSGDHMHLGVKSTFADNAFLFRNFVVDYVNHVELYEGALLNDPYNAPGIGSIGNKRNAFAKVIQDFDQGNLKTIEELSRAIEEKVYLGQKHYQALGLKRITDSSLPENQRTLEVRAVRGFDDPNKVFLVHQLFLSRMNYLEKINRPINFLEHGSILSVSAGASRFRQYIEECGLNWSDYVTLLPSTWQVAATDISESESYHNDNRDEWYNEILNYFHNYLNQNRPENY